MSCYFVAADFDTLIVKGLDTNKQVYLETERLIIRDPSIEDFEAIWKMRIDKAVTEFTGGITKLTKDEAYERHLKNCSDTDNGPKEYAVILKSSNAYIGYCGFQYCSMLGGIEIMYGFDKAFWGNGYAVEASKAVLEFGLNELKLDKIVAAVNTDNIASDKVLKKIGMTFIKEEEWPDQGMVKRYEY